MRKPFQKILLSLAIIFIGLQFFQPDKNQGILSTGEDLFSQVYVDDSIKVLLETSCFDCHSNHTNYPWYGQIPPVSIFLNKHIVEGKKELNFTEWSSYTDKDKISKLVDIYDEVESGNMPLESYLKIHKDATLSEHEKQLILSWAEKEGLVLLMNKK